MEFIYWSLPLSRHLFFACCWFSLGRLIPTSITTLSYLLFLDKCTNSPLLATPAPSLLFLVIINPKIPNANPNDRNTDNHVLGLNLPNNQVELRLPPATQSKLVALLEVLIDTGTRAVDRLKTDSTFGGRKKKDKSSGEDGERFPGSTSSSEYYRRGRSRGFQGSMYWGTQRGYAGVVLDDEGLRRSLPRQLMQLYASVGQVEGLTAEMHLKGFKLG